MHTEIKYLLRFSNCCSVCNCSGRDTTKPGTKNSAASEFSSMKREMESHSPSRNKLTKPHSTSPRQATQHGSQQSPTKQHKSQTDRGSVRASSEQKDEFSDAMSALSKLNISSPHPSSSLSDTKKSKQQHSPENRRGGAAGRGKEREGEKKSRELSPSVAAMFDAVSELEDKGHVGHIQETREKLSTNEGEEPTQTLKSMLRMSSATKTPQSSSEMPDAILKLMGPPTGGQNRPLLRAPLLPNPSPAPYMYFQGPHVPIRGK